MHLKIYSRSQNVNAVIHVHPPYSTALSTCHSTVKCITASSIFKLKNIKLIPYADPGSIELSNLVEETVSSEDRALVLYSHGIITLDSSLSEAFDIADLVEETAVVNFISKLYSSKKVSS